VGVFEYLLASEILSGCTPVVHLVELHSRGAGQSHQPGGENHEEDHQAQQSPPPAELVEAEP
jgi:hypothetical protein